MRGVMLRGRLKFGKRSLPDSRGWCGVWKDITVGDVTGFNVIAVQGSSIYFSSRTLTPEKTSSHPDHNQHSGNHEYLVFARIIVSCVHDQFRPSLLCIKICALPGLPVDHLLSLHVKSFPPSPTRFRILLPIRWQIFSTSSEIGFRSTTPKTKTASYPLLPAS